MSQDDDKKAPKKPNQPRVFSDELVNQIKNEIIRGVGYRSPPADKQFKKGQSGNPKGRPKKVDRLDGAAYRIFLEEAERMVSIREGDEIREVPAINAVHRAEIASAAKGNSNSQRNASERYERATVAREKERQKWIERAEQHIAWCNRQIADAKAKGEAPPVLLPHPDDVIIDKNSEIGVRIIGPSNEEELKRYMENVRFRDLLLMQNALDYKLADEKHEEFFLEDFGPAFSFAAAVNETLPKRFRLTEIGLAWNERVLLARSKRRLLKDLYRGWRSFGRPVPRGWMFPMIRHEKVVELLATTLHAINPNKRAA